MVSTVVTVQLLITLFVVYQQWSFVKNGTAHLITTPKSLAGLPVDHASDLRLLQLHNNSRLAGGGGAGLAGDRMFVAPRIVIVTPHIMENVPRLMESWRSWAKIGRACTPRYTGKVDMVFYINGKPDDYDPAELLENRLKAESALLAPILDCFGSVKTVFAELTDEEDGYPEGINHMFFKLFLDPRLTGIFKSYTHMFWAEWDVSPLRPHWLDKLREEAEPDDFWMKGSPYKGESLDAQALIPGNWDWIGHINGNALYKLHDPDFMTLMRLTTEREPPSHFWKPFDVSMWRVVHEMPYSWHIFQAYRDKFRFTEFIINLGYMLQQEDIARAQNNPDVFFMHGDSKSAGIVKQTEKFKDTQRTSKVQWTDPVAASLGLSVFMRVRLRNLDYVFLALKSLERHLKGALETVIVVPEEEYAAFQQMLPAGVRLVKEKPVEGLDPDADDALQAQATELMADTYVTGKYVLHMPFDAVLRKDLLMRDIFIFRKPMAAVYPATTPRCQAYRDAAGVFLGATKPAYCFVGAGGEYVLPVTAHAATRGALAASHQAELRRFLEAWKASGVGVEVGGGVGGGNVQRAPPGFNAVNVIKTYLFERSPEQVSWIYMGLDDGPTQVKVPTNFKPVRWPLLCKGNATLTEGKATHRNRQLQVLESAIKAPDCNELKVTLEEISAQLEQPKRRRR